MGWPMGCCGKRRVVCSGWHDACDSHGRAAECQPGHEVAPGDHRRAPRCGRGAVPAIVIPLPERAGGRQPRSMAPPVVDLAGAGRSPASAGHAAHGLLPAASPCRRSASGPLRSRAACCVFPGSYPASSTRCGCRPETGQSAAPLRFVRRPLPSAAVPPWAPLECPGAVIGAPSRRRGGGTARTCGLWRVGNAGMHVVGPWAPPGCAVKAGVTRPDELTVFSDGN